MQQRIMAMGCFMGQTPHMQVHTPDYVVPLASVCCQGHQVQLCQQSAGIRASSMLTDVAFIDLSIS